MEEIKIKDASIEQLKIAAFDLVEKITELQNIYQIVLNEIRTRKKDENNSVKTSKSE